MKKILLCFILLATLLVADEQPPVFLPIESTEDFYSGSNIILEVQATDESLIEDILLYYRFSKGNPFTSVIMEKEMFYVGEIPESEVRPGKLEYYFFARDEFGNQSTWPERGENSPESYPVFEPLFSGVSHGDILIDLLNPIADEITEEASIIILSLYDPEESLNLDDIRLFIDDEDVSEFIFRSRDMVTYVPRNSLNPGKHIVEVKLADDEGVYLTKKFKFTLAEINLSAIEKVDFRKKFKFKGSISYNSDYDEFFGKDRPENRPMDSHKLNLSAKFTIGDFKVKSSILMNTHLFDETARLALDRSQPSNRLKLGISSPFMDFKYGDFSTEFSEFTLKGTRVRGTYTRFKLGPWKTSIVSGNTKEKIAFENQTGYDSGYGIWSDREAEDYDDSNGNGQWDEGELFIDCAMDNEGELICEGDGNWDVSLGNGEWDSADTFKDNPSTVDGIPVSDNDNVSHVIHTKGTASRKMDAIRTELDFSKFNFGINILKSYDNIEQYDPEYEELYDQYTFLGNAVVGMDFTIRLNNKKTQFKGESAISLMNDLRGTSIEVLGENLGMDPDEIDSNKEILQTIEDLVGFSVNSDLILGTSEGRGISIPLPDMDNLDPKDYVLNSVFKQGTYRFLFKTPIEFEENSFDLQAEYKRVPSNFISLGNSSIQTDIQGLRSSIKARLLKNILSVNLGYDNEHDNLLGELPEEKLKSSTSTSITKSGGLGVSYLDYPSINYSVRVMNREGISVQELDIVTSNKTITHTISPSYKFETENDLNVSLGGNLMMMDYNDNLYNPSDTTTINTNFTTGSYTGTLGLRFDSPLSFNLGGGLSIISPEDVNSNPTEFLVITSKVGYKFMEKTLSTFLGLNVVSGSKEADIEGNGGIDNLKMTVKVGAQYKFTSAISVGLNVNFISLSDNITSTNDFSELKGKLKLKMVF